MKVDYDRFGGFLAAIFWIQIMCALWFGVQLIRNVSMLMRVTDVASEKVILASVLTGVIVLNSLGSAFLMKLKRKFFFALTKVLFSGNVVVIFVTLIAALVMSDIYPPQTALWVFGVPLLIEIAVLVTFSNIKHAKVYYRLGI